MTLKLFTGDGRQTEVAPSWRERSEARQNADKLIAAYLNELQASIWLEPVDPKKYDSGRDILDASRKIGKLIEELLTGPDRTTKNVRPNQHRRVPTDPIVIDRQTRVVWFRPCGQACAREAPRADTALAGGVSRR